jgi:thiamine biosynthesis lipoprotein
MQNACIDEAAMGRVTEHGRWSFWAHCLLLLIVCATPAGAAERMFVESRPAMGTKFTIYLYAPDQETAAAAFGAAFEEIERVEEDLSTYRPTSELSRINHTAGHQSITTDPETFRLLQISLGYGAKTGGAFDVTVGPLMRAWGFFRGQGKYPADAELAEARAQVGWQRVVLDPRNRTLRFDQDGVELDLGGIGKGYAADRVAEVLRDAGIKAALVDAGSSTIYALGAPPGKSAWRVRISRPGHPRYTLAMVSLRDTSVSTSGSYEKFFRLNGHVYCHIMDPRIGKPVEGMLQTTVIAPSAMDSDALSTSTFVLGPFRAKPLLRTMAGTAALWVEGQAAAPRVVTWRWPTQVASTSGHQRFTGSTSSGLEPRSLPTAGGR